MFIFRKQTEIFGDVNFLYRNKRCFRSDTLQHCLCLVTEWAIRFRVELELHRKIHISEFSTSHQKSHPIFCMN